MGKVCLQSAFPRFVLSSAYVAESIRQQSLWITEENRTIFKVEPFLKSESGKASRKTDNIALTRPLAVIPCRLILFVRRKTAMLSDQTCHFSIFTEPNATVRYGDFAPSVSFLILSSGIPQSI